LIFVIKFHRLIKEISYSIPIETYQEELQNSLFEIKIQVSNWARKYVKLISQLKQWQGAWRDYELFDLDNMRILQLPLKLSQHTFSNGCRALMKLRKERTQCVPAADYPKSNIDLYENENIIFEKIRDIQIFNSQNMENLPKIMNNPYIVKGYNLDLLNENTKKNEISEQIALFLYKIQSSSNKEIIPVPLDCEIYTILYAKKGKLVICGSKNTDSENIEPNADNLKCDLKIKFIISEQKFKEDDRLMFNYEHRKNSKLVKEYKITDIKSVYKKYIVEQKTAIEIYYYTGKSILFNFNKEDDRDYFCNRLMKVKERYGLKFDIYPKSSVRLVEKQIIEDWINWKISTFDYLLALNNFSGRSFQNVSQYPVFPWVLDTFSTPNIDLTDNTIYRDLAKNVGMLGDKTRAEDFKSRYELEDLTGLGQFHFGSHYSNPGIVFQYMMRIFPIMEAYIKFFSGLDDPNRMFHSVIESLHSAKRDSSDVREIIPEFFAFPDMFINREGLNFGQREEDKTKINHVVLPKWAKDSPHIFVSLLREALESSYVSNNINRWIDLIFGYQQQGKEAEKAFNIFPRLSYDPAKILAKTSGPQHDSYRMQAYHWGQTPLQLLLKKHPERLVKNPDFVYSILDPNAKPNAYTPEIHLEKYVGSKLKASKIIKIFTSDESDKNPSFTLVTLDGTLLDFVIEFVEPDLSKENGNKTASPWFVDSTPRKYMNRYFSDNIILLDPIIETNFPVVMVKKHTPLHIAQGGYIDGNIQLTQIGKLDKIFLIKAHKDTCTALEIDKNERFAISGSLSGELVIFNIKPGMQWTMKKQIWDHGDTITHIFVSDSMQLFCSSSLDGYTNLYTFNGNLLRKFKHPSGFPIHYSVLGQNPLPCLLMYSREDGIMYCFSLSGDLISKDSDTTKNVIGFTIGQDSNFNDHITYIKDRDFILTARKLPTLERRMLAIKKRATAFAIFENKQMAVIGDESGGFAFIWDPKSINNSQNKPLLIP